MAIASASYTTSVGSGSGGSGALSLPGGAVAGQFALATIAFNTGNLGTSSVPAFTPPVGFTTIQLGESAWIGYRFVQAGDNTFAYTRGVGGGGYTPWVVSTFTGVDTTNPVDAFAVKYQRGFVNEGTGGGYCPPVNPNYANDMLVHVAGGASATSSITAPTGLTGVGSIANSAYGACCRQAILQLTSAATTASYMAGQAAITAYASGFSGVVLLKAAGDTPVTPSAPFPYLAVTATNTANTISSVTSFVINTQGIPAVGDLMLVHVTVSNPGAVITPPDGTWAQLMLATNGVNTFYRLAQSGDPTTFTFGLANSGSTDFTTVFQLVKKMGSTRVLGIDTYGYNSAASSTTMPSTPALMLAGANELLLTLLANDGTTTAQITYAPGSSGAVSETMNYGYGNSHFGWLINPSNPTPTVYGTKSAAGVQTDIAAAFAIRLVPPQPPRPQQMILM